MSADEEYSEGGSRIYRHTERQFPEEIVSGDLNTIDRISEHIEAHLGPVETVYHELISDQVHIDVHCVLPSPGRDFITLVTSGMSDLPMTVPEGAEAWEYAELVINLPKDWPLDEESFADESHYWPVRALKFHARFPHLFGTWFGWGHTIPNGDPPEKIANTGFTGVLLSSCFGLPEAFSSLEMADERIVNFFNIVPLYPAEMDLKLKKGAEVLEELFVKNGITGPIDIHRKNVARKRWLIF